MAVAVGSLIVTWVQSRFARVNAAVLFIALPFFGWLRGIWGPLLGAPLAATYRPSASARYGLRIAKAQADYSVVKEMCDESRAGNAKDVCVKKAAAARIAASADANVDLKTVDANRAANEKSAAASVRAGEQLADARKEAALDKREAEYAVAKKKCDALSGDPKHLCVKDAKARCDKPWVALLRLVTRRSWATPGRVSQIEYRAFHSGRHPVGGLRRLDVLRGQAVQVGVGVIGVVVEGTSCFISVSVPKSSVWSRELWPQPQWPGYSAALYWLSWISKSAAATSVPPDVHSRGSVGNRSAASAGSWSGR